MAPFRSAAEKKAESIASNIGRVFRNVTPGQDLKLVEKARGSIPENRDVYLREVSLLRICAVELAVERYLDDPRQAGEVRMALERHIGEMFSGSSPEAAGLPGLYRARKAGYSAVFLKFQGGSDEQLADGLAEVFAGLVGNPAGPGDIKVGRAVIDVSFSSVQWICNEVTPARIDVSRLRAPELVVLLSLAAGLALAVYAAYVMSRDVVSAYFPGWQLPPAVWLLLGIPATLYVAVKYGVWTPFLLWLMSILFLAGASRMGLGGNIKRGGGERGGLNR